MKVTGSIMTLLKKTLFVNTVGTWARTKYLSAAGAVKSLLAGSISLSKKAYIFWVCLMVSSAAHANPRKSAIMSDNSIFDSIKRGLGSLLNFSEWMAVIAILIAAAFAWVKTSITPNGQPFLQNIKMPLISAVGFSVFVLFLDWVGIDTALISSARETTGSWKSSG